MTETFAIVGDGGWGTAVGLLLLENGHDVVLVGRDPAHLAAMAATRENARYLPGVRLPDALRFSADAADAISGAGTIVNAVPTQWIRERVQAAAGASSARASASSRSPRASRSEACCVPSEVLREMAPKSRIAVALRPEPRGGSRAPLPRVGRDRVQVAGPRPPPPGRADHDALPRLHELRSASASSSRALSRT